MGEDHFPRITAVLLLLSELVIMVEDHLPPISVVLVLNEL
jgi:hypothetical protein